MSHQAKYSLLGKRLVPKRRIEIWRAVLEVFTRRRWLDRLRCTGCGKPARDHIWACTGCGEALPKDADGLPIFGEHALFAELVCPKPETDLN